MEDNSPDTAAEQNPETPETPQTVQAVPSYSGDALIWLKTLPNSLDRADLFTLNDNDVAIKCISELVANKPFTIPVEATHPATLWFHHFFFEAKNREKVFGTRNLGVGYPMVVAKVEDYNLSAPLFIYQVQLEPHEHHPDEWSILKSETHLIQPNYPLFHLIDNLKDTKFSEEARKLAESRNVTATALTQLAERVRATLDLSEEGLPLSVQPCPPKG